MGMPNWEKLDVRVRASLQVARTQRRVQDMAEAIGCYPQQLSAFLKGGTLAPQYVESARDLLIQWGWWFWSDDHRPARDADVRWHAIAEDLRSVAGFIDAPGIDDGSKAHRLTAFFTFYHRLMESLIPKDEADHPVGDADGGE